MTLLTVKSLPRRMRFVSAHFPMGTPMPELVVGDMVDVTAPGESTVTGVVVSISFRFVRNVAGLVIG